MVCAAAAQTGMPAMECVRAVCPDAVSCKAENVFRKAETSVSSEEHKFPAGNLNDGDLSRKSAWKTDRYKRAPHIVEVNLPFYVKLDSIVLHTGILPEEMLQEETGRAAGYWCAKNFSLQYWDDANWTDIAGADVTENRKERVSFCFDSPITSFRFRFVCTDGEQIIVREIEGFGREDKTLPAPSPVNGEKITVTAPEKTSFSGRVSPAHAGTSMKYVGYNQGYLVPGNNAGAWLEYSGVNIIRIWADLRNFVPEDAMKDFGTISDEAGFLAAKAKFLANPLKYVPLSRMDELGTRMYHSTNSMVFKHALNTMRGLGIEVLIQSGIDRRYYDASWQHRWDLWQRFYSQVFWSARNGGVEHYALCNEPNHRNAGPMPLDSWIELAKVARDASQCAIRDVNRIDGTSYKARFVGPVTAGTNLDWWRKIAAQGDIVDVFSTHSYNIPAAGYKGRVQMIDKLIRENHPQHRSIPIVFTETGRWMNAYLIDKEETMDSPSLFTEWAGMYTENMLEGCYGMWAFKFANTSSGTYPRGIKSGHHHQFKGLRFAEDSFENLALGAKVKISSGRGASLITDGDKSTAWETSERGGQTIELNLAKNSTVGGICIYSGSEGGEFTAPDRMRSFKVELQTADGWKEVASEKNNKYAQVFYTVEPAVAASAVRISIDDATSAKVREVKVFGEGTLSSATESYDVGGAQRTAEVVRLFAKGFKGGRPLLKVSSDTDGDQEFDFVACENPADGTRYVWLVQRNLFDYDGTIDLGALGVKNDNIVCETVSADSYGEAKILRAENGVLKIKVPAQSVNLLTISASQSKVRTVKSKAAASVRGGVNGAEKKSPSVQLDSRTLEDNSVYYTSFDLSKADAANAGRILLGVYGGTQDGKSMRVHAYGFGEKLDTSDLDWSNAPHLDRGESRILSGDKGVFVAGEPAFSEDGWHWLDVTEAVKKHGSDAVTFAVARELREPGDDYDKGRKVMISTKHKPVLKIW